MRIVVWNCNMAMHRKLDLLLALRPDIAVLPECAGPGVKAAAPIYAAATSHAWVGNVPTKGLAVLAFDSWRFTELPRVGDGQFAIPLRVDGPISFRLLAIWTQKPGYIEQLLRVLTDQAEFLRGPGPLVVAGDLNSNRNWDHLHGSNNHSRLVERLEALGLFSAYHAHHEESQGAESRATFHFYRHANKPFHIDYAFLPNSWRPLLRSVDVGLHDPWCASSDHVPMTVAIDMPAPAVGSVDR
jgi:exodeoxyribonuclease-3